MAGWSRRTDGRVVKIVEEKDATPEEKKIREINTGIYCVESRFLFPAVAGLGNRNAQREYYLTDIVEIACQQWTAGEFVPGARSGGGDGDQHA